MSHDDELELVEEHLYQSGTVAIEKYKVLGSPNDHVCLQFMQNGRLFKRSRLRDGVLYCETGPAVETWHPNGALESVHFYPITTPALGPDEPDLQEFFPNGVLAGEETRLYDAHGMLIGKKRKDWYNNGQLRIKAYYEYDNAVDPALPFPTKGTMCVSRRGDKPAIREWYRNGRLKTEKYFVLDQLHRENGGDMVTCYHTNGRKKFTMRHVCSRIIRFEYDTKERVRVVQCQFFRGDGLSRANHFIIFKAEGSIQQERLELDAKAVEPHELKGVLEELLAAKCPHTPRCPTS